MGRREGGGGGGGEAGEGHAGTPLGMYAYLDSFNISDFLQVLGVFCRGCIGNKPIEAINRTTTVRTVYGVDIPQGNRSQQDPDEAGIQGHLLVVPKDPLVPQGDGHCSHSSGSVL